MSTITTPIEPEDIITKRTAVSFTIDCQNLTLFTSASFMVSLQDQNGGIINTQLITLTQEQYLAWNNNDEYIVNLIASILGVTPISA
jgi:hypothetical protein